MKYMKIILFITLLSFINNIDTKLKHDSLKNNIRSLWEEDMEYTIKDEDKDSDSLWHCSYSNYKYFSFILTGAPVTFDHFVSKDNAVSIIIF